MPHEVRPWLSVKTPDTYRVRAVRQFVKLVERHRTRMRRHSRRRAPLKKGPGERPELNTVSAGQCSGTSAGQEACVSDMWLVRLSKPISLTDGRVLRTLDDIRALLVELPEATRLDPHWQRLGELLLSAAQGGGVIDVATDQLKVAMWRSPFDGVSKLVAEDLEKEPLAPSVKRRRPPKKAL